MRRLEITALHPPSAARAARTLAYYVVEPDGRLRAAAAAARFTAAPRFAASSTAAFAHDRVNGSKRRRTAQALRKSARARRAAAALAHERNVCLLHHLAHSALC